MLVDGDPNRSATKWAKRGHFSFQVIDERHGIRRAGDFVHTVIDTEAHPSREDMEALAGGCDLLIIPSTPDRLSLDALVDTVTVLRSLGADRWRILLTMVPPPPAGPVSGQGGAGGSRAFPCSRAASAVIRRFRRRPIWASSSPRSRMRGRRWAGRTIRRSARR